MDDEMDPMGWSLPSQSSSSEEDDSTEADSSDDDLPLATLSSSRRLIGCSDGGSLNDGHPTFPTTICVLSPTGRPADGQDGGHGERTSRSRKERGVQNVEGQRILI
mmetsp:Transcript_3251/g.7191  ORF Transcript_3251/g.7191 Transcript_3251/m.7191 type:complete len:106 (+) Transcript_3251:430-747(+)